MDSGEPGKIWQGLEKLLGEPLVDDSPRVLCHKHRIIVGPGVKQINKKNDRPARRYVSKSARGEGGDG